MGEIGSGNGSSYPNSYDTDSSQESTSTVARHQVVNDLAACILNIEQELGLNPSAYRKGYRGVRQGCLLEYKGAADIYVNPGIIEVNGYIAVISSQQTLDWTDLDTGSEANSTWYYVYVVKPSSNGGSPTFKISATAPSSLDDTGGRYHPSHATWRCTGSFYNNSSGDIREAYRYGDGWTLLETDTTVLSAGSATTFTDVDCSSACPATAEKIRVSGIINTTGNTDNLLYVRRNGSPNADGICIARCYKNPNTDDLHFPFSADISIDSSQIFEYRKAGGTSDVYIYLYGYWENL